MIEAKINDFPQRWEFIKENKKVRRKKESFSFFLVAFLVESVFFLFFFLDRYNFFLFFLDRFLGRKRVFLFSFINFHRGLTISLRLGPVWFVSHCNAHSGRDKLVNFMQDYIGVDIFGKCGPYKESKIYMLWFKKKLVSRVIEIQQEMTKRER